MSSQHTIEPVPFSKNPDNELDNSSGTDSPPPSKKKRGPQLKLDTFTPELLKLLSCKAQEALKLGDDSLGMIASYNKVGKNHLPGEFIKQYFNEQDIRLTLEAQTAAKEGPSEIEKEADAKYGLKTEDYQQDMDKLLNHPDNKAYEGILEVVRLVKAEKLAPFKAFLKRKADLKAAGATVPKPKKRRA